MLGFALIAFPFGLLGFVLIMQRVEEPLRHVADDREIETFLDNANRDELNTLVIEGTDPAVRKYRRRLRLSRRRKSWRRGAD